MIIYLASPYTHPDPEVKEERVRQICAIAGRLMRQGLHVFSPISHTHAIAKCADLPGTYEFWEEYDRKFLSVCGELWVATIDGWEESKGVQAEIAIARQLNIPVRYIGPYDQSPH